RVTIAIDKQYSIRSHEEAVIVPDLLSRDTTIDFVPAPPPKPPAPRPQSRAEEIVPAQFVQAPEQGKAPPPPPPEPVPLGQPIPPGSEIKGRAPPDARALLREAADVVP